MPVVQLEESYGNIEKQIQGLPLWMKSAAKLLNSGDENQDWMALARLLGRSLQDVICMIDCVCVLFVDIRASGKTLAGIPRLVIVE